MVIATSIPTSVCSVFINTSCETFETDLVNGPVVVYASALFVDPCEMCSVIKNVFSDYKI